VIEASRLIMYGIGTCNELRAGWLGTIEVEVGEYKSRQLSAPFFIGSSAWQVVAGEAGHPYIANKREHF
jgi:hypothetical protein